MTRWKLSWVPAILVAATACDEKVTEPEPVVTGEVTYWLTVLHNNDAESDLVNAGRGLEDYGGVARFATLVARLRAEALTGPAPEGIEAEQGVILVSSGDNFLAGPEFSLSLEPGRPFYDALALDRIGYDAIAIGNHEFDFGPAVLADFIDSFDSDVPFLSANLDVSGEAELAALRGSGRIAPSVVIEEQGRRIGVIGATTPDLRFISSPRNVVVQQNVAAQIQAQVAALEAAGVNIIVLISHLQSIEEDRQLVPLLDGVDIVVAGGGDDLLANAGDVLLPGAEPAGPYPTMLSDVNGTRVPVVTTEGGYRYVGRLVAGFDDAGDLIEVAENLSGPVRVAGGSQADAVTADAQIDALVVKPVEEELSALGASIVATSEVPLNGLRPEVRTKETNQGNLIADAILWQARQLNESFGVPEPDVALQNGGGIRNASTIPAGPITELTTFDILPFGNFVAVVPQVPRAQFKEILENAVSAVENTDGRFAQVAGFRFEYTTTGAAQQLDASGNVTTAGTRIREVTLDDGTPIVQNGAVVPGPALDVAIVDFSARGGDQYPFRGAGFTTLGVTYQQALEKYLVQALGGAIRASDYPVGGEGRIVRR